MGKLLHADNGDYGIGLVNFDLTELKQRLALIYPCRI